MADKAQDTLVAGDGTDTVSATDSISSGDGEATVSGAEASDTVVDTGDQPRDELHDSIDPTTGVLTPLATELRAERGVSRSGLQADGSPE